MNIDQIAPQRANPDDTNDVKVACHVCLTEVPISGAKSEETSDYVAHFCGLECYDKWRTGRPEVEALR